MSSVSRTLAHRNLSPDFMEELKQELRASLLVGSMEKPAKLASYAGQGPLK
ncbi:transcriptional regulator, partial [Haliangium sp. UPWRP_2]